VVDPAGPEAATDHHKAEANRLIAYHSPISQQLTTERTSLESRLIPVSAYILVACVESWYRYPTMMRTIDAAMRAERIGARGRRPGCRVNTVYLWSIANFWLIGRKVMATMGMPDDAEQAFTVLDFWERAAIAFRGGDGTRQAVDAGGIVRPYGADLVAALLVGAAPVDDETRARIKRFNATLVNYLFLLYFDTRVGTGDTGPYEVPGEPGHTLLVRDFYRLAKSDFWWSDVAEAVPYQNLTAALVLDDVQVRITDFGTSNTTPEDYLDRLVRFGLFTTDGAEPGVLRPVPLEELDVILDSVRAAQARLYRAIANMTRDEKIRCGAYVYFSFLKPFADEAGVGDELDWTVPRAVPAPLYELLSMAEGDNAGVDMEEEYYGPIA
jgi:hypothetical protein